jgi:hypothetical protein
MVKPAKKPSMTSAALRVVLFQLIQHLVQLQQIDAGLGGGRYEVG